jgi:(p)ppGpp synthase/HD superfamily hydrolase
VAKGRPLGLKRDDMSARPEIIALATRLHFGQVDKAGKPYVEHLSRVAANLIRLWPDAPRDQVEAAWLHDSLEDTQATEASLATSGVSSETIRIVRAVTRPHGGEYLAWIADLAATRDQPVIRVKLADNLDNSDPARVALLSDGADRVAKRYAPARRLLEAALDRPA